jgi:hypothetical protein
MQSLLSLQDLALLKAATRRGIAGVGGQESAALDLGKAQCTVSEYQNPQRLDRFIPIDCVAALERCSGRPHITQALARLSGHVLIELPREAGDGVWTRQLGQIAKEVGEAMAALGEAVAKDGAVTAAEIAELRIIEELQEAIAALSAAKRQCEEIVKDAAGEGHHGAAR